MEGAAGHPWKGGGVIVYFVWEECESCFGFDPECPMCDGAGGRDAVALPPEEEPVQAAFRPRCGS